MITNSLYMLQHQSAICRDSTNTKDQRTKTRLPLIALTVIFETL